MNLEPNSRAAVKDTKLRPLAYWATQGRFNLTALLQTGRFYLDEAGLLVAPNGTRYRIPSGPPEGRKPLRPDRLSTTVNSQGTGHQGDLFSIEQQDSSKSGQWGFGKSASTQDELSPSHFPPPRPLNSEPISWNHSNHISQKSDLLGSGGSTQSIANVVTQLDWNVILMTVILSSIALVCNLALVVLLSWKTSQLRKLSPTARSGSDLSPEIPSDSPSRLHVNSAPNHPNSRCHCISDRVPSSNDPTKRTMRCSHDINFPDTGECTRNHTCQKDPLSFHNQLSHRYRHRRGRRRQRHVGNRRSGSARPAYCHSPLARKNPLYLNPGAPFARTEMSLLGDLGPATPFMNPADHIDVGSSSGGSWHVVVSDGMISETTADEAAEEDNNDDGNTTTGESATNSDIVFRATRRPHTSVAVHRSGSTPDDIGRYGDRTSVMYNQRTKRRAVNARCTRLDTIRSNQLPEFDCESSTSSLESTTSNERERIGSSIVSCSCPTGTLYVCHSLGIHFGFLGILLSLIQLIVVCSALSRRMIQSSISVNLPTTAPVTESYLSELVCVMATSLAADTLVCARQYVIAAILLVFWSASYAALVQSSTAGRSRTTLSSFSLVNHAEPEEAQQVKRNRPDEAKRQQQYAYMALTHSLPWALAAGTALLITFAIPTNHTEATSPKMQVKLNLFFRGLESLLVCQLDPRHPAGLRTESAGLLISTDLPPTVHNFTSARTASSADTQSWIAWSMLILLPLCIQVVFCTVYAILIRVGMQRHHGLKRLVKESPHGSGKIMFYLLGSILALIILEYVSCAVPVVWAMLSSTETLSATETKHAQSSAYLYRLIILHLLFDPWIIACVLRPIMTHIVRSAKVTFDLKSSQHSELASRSWSVESQLRNQQGNGTYPTDHEDKQINFADSNRRPVSSVGFMSCLPITGCISNPESQGVANPSTGQTMLMSYVPSTNFYVSPFQPLPHSSGLDGNLFVPVDENPVRLAPSQSNTLNLTHFATNHAPLSMSVTFENQTQSPVIGSLPKAISDNGPDVFPQLCEHHQKLLEQHYAVRLPTSIGTVVCTSSDGASAKGLEGQTRAFGQVPRLNPVNVNFTDSLMMKPVLRLASEGISSSTSTGPEVLTPQTSTSAHLRTHHHIVGADAPSILDETGKYVPLSRPPAGKSQATAAVMAAAAAAVAAQAGTMTRSSGENTVLESGQQQQQSTETKPTPVENHSNLSVSRWDETTHGGQQAHVNDHIHPEQQ